MPNLPDLGYELGAFDLEMEHHAFDAEVLGACRHCGEAVWTDDDPGECPCGVAHGECILTYGCQIA